MNRGPHVISKLLPYVCVSCGAFARDKWSLWFYSNLLTLPPNMMSRLCIRPHNTAEHVEREKTFLTSCCNACHPSQSHHFPTFHSFYGFHLALSVNGVHVRSWPCTKKTFQGSIHRSFLTGTEAEKRRRRNIKLRRKTQSRQITEMSILMGLILSLDLQDVFGETW